LTHPGLSDKSLFEDLKSESRSWTGVSTSDRLFHERRLRREGFTRIAGIDEAGRGPLAGPVVAAAVLLPIDNVVPEVNDSKQLTDEKRRTLLEDLRKKASSIGLGIVWEKDIDRINILQATLRAMSMAVGNLWEAADYVLVDGNRGPELTIPSLTIVDGDETCYSIAAASIIAKVARDDIMTEFDRVFPEYGFASHKGYSTEEHRAAIQRHGPCPIHRRSFNWGEA
jgi:ribonuclease HII